MKPSADQRMPWMWRYVQRPIAYVLRRIAPESYLWWDVATFSSTARYVCCSCGRHSFTERTHLTHSCRCEV